MNSSVPRQLKRSDFLGIMLSTQGSCRAWIDKEKVEELRAHLHKMMVAAEANRSLTYTSHRNGVPVRIKKLERLLGQFVFASSVVNSLTLYMRFAFADLHKSS